MNRDAARAPGLLQGFGYPFRGMRFVFRTHPGLIRYWIVPVALSAVAFLWLTYWVLGHHAELAAQLWDTPSGDGALGWMLSVLHGALGWLLALLLLVAGAFGILLVSGVVAAPFNEALSAEVERLVGGGTALAAGPVAFVKDVVRSIGIELVKLLVLLVVLAPLGALQLLVAALAPVFTATGFILAVAYIALDYTDWPAARRGHGLRRRLAWMRQHSRPLAGFGVGAWVLLAVPGVNLLLMPAAVCGGTLLYLDLESVTRVEASEGAAVRPANAG